MHPRHLRSTAFVVLVTALALAPCAPAVAASQVQEQLEFGVKMARRGLWSEALFRFRQAHDLEPGNPRILNNLAVAYEAVGQFEEALSIYQEAIRKAPSNPELKRNYAQFLEFYQGFRPREEETEPPADGSASAEGESGGGR